MTPEGVIERVLSVSFLATATSTEQRSIAEEVRHLLSTSPETADRSILELPYRTDVYVAHRRRSLGPPPARNVRGDG